VIWTCDLARGRGEHELGDAGLLASDLLPELPLALRATKDG
jgi:hypothetical protein